MVTAAQAPTSPESVLQPKKDPSAFDSGVKNQLKAIGSSGTEVFGGYFTEEYLQLLRGARGAKIWDEMRRSEPQVAMILSAIQNPIKAANWDFQPAKKEDVADADKHVLLCETVFKEGLDWEASLHEMLTLVHQGFSLFERTDNVVFNHPKLGTFNGIKALGFRSQKTIYAWKLEPGTGKILTVEQFAYSDIGKNAVMEGDFLVVFSLHKEGDNYEGISALRPMYGPWFRKNLYQKLAAIGIEKYAVGTPIATVPPGKEKTEEFDALKAILEAYTSHESSYIIVPEGWKIEIQKGEFDASKIKEMILLENNEMINCVVANFLALGGQHGSGAHALSSDLSSFFLMGIQSYANLIAGVFNRCVIPDLIKKNYGPQAAYPKLKCTGINETAGLDLANILATLADKKLITPDMPLEEFLRNTFHTPPADPTTSRMVQPAPQVPQPTVPGVHLSSIQLADPSTENDFTKNIDSGKAQVKGLMQARLKGMADDLKKKLKNKGNPGQAEIDPKLISDYQLALQNELSKVAAQALSEVEKEVGKSTKLSESIMLAAKPGAGSYNALPDKIKKIVETQAQLLSTTQAADIAKIVSFQYASSSTGTEDDAQIDSEIDASVNKTLDGDNSRGMSVDAAAGDVVAQVSNQARTEYFFEPEVLDQIESFTFENNDPVSEICQSLAGTTFAPDDPQVDEFTPPLHHNCKSRMTANLVGVSGNPSVDGKVDLSESAKKSMTL